jgi:biofilm PGA synthesis N-glycosyltransferase PgaC
MPGRSYAIVTPCRNEADHIRETIRTVVEQETPASKWVIVDDGSTDETPKILREAAELHDCIEIVTRGDRGDRAVGAGVIEAVSAGLRAIDLDEYDYLCKLDADLELPPRYFTRMIDEMEREPLLGNFSGKVYLRLDDGRLVCERMGDENAIGAAKFYRMRCFRDIGGFVEHIGWDGIDGHICRLKGWIARSTDDPEIRIVHRRLMGSSHRSIWYGRVRWGRLKWYQGSALYYILGVTAYRLFDRPFVIGGLGILWGYLRSMMAGAPRFDYPGYRTALRRFERISFFRGKAKAIETFEREARQRRVEQQPT